ncbi:cupin domain-containing protein [Lasiosphaeria miniovina]|uniref:Cupin domain-containing protein n=1 Tax=Lasiosphaeria miniovina TaxID=1954250 RepID=A0AA40B6T9_9PEZI|nr:cupin domain-containing protein [Lasiosphaeria miniovina]KAK0728745.1 cupin domain-containing protein [Lasiosphaeria miniovina]
MATPQNQDTSAPRAPNRFITDHNAAGLSVFDASIPEAVPTQAMGRMSFQLGYATTSLPADFSSGADVAQYSSFLTGPPPGIYIPGGSVLRIVEMQPGGASPMHRTVSLDYGVVLDGAAELVLDSGESRVLERGDMVVQRGTNHLWRNKSATETSRMLFVTLESKPVEVGGKLLSEDLAGL